MTPACGLSEYGGSHCEVRNWCGMFRKNDITESGQWPDLKGVKLSPGF